jgi:arabinose-5-phosphate isomerase
MLKNLFEEQKGYINNFFEFLDFNKAEEILEAFLCCKGTIFFTGIGKSSFVANKIAATLCSTGTKAYYIPTTDAMHGDLGIVSANDIVVMISKSGESDELLNLAPYIRNKGARIIAFVSNPRSRLSKACDLFIYLPLEKELCPFNLAPTTSVAIHLIFGDILAVALMRAKGFSLDAYAKNHPAGRIGKRISLKVGDLMLKDDKLPLCGPQDKLVDILVELSQKQCGCILIVDTNQRLLGIFTDGDLRRALQKHKESVLQETMDKLMNPTPRYLKNEALAWDAVKFMEEDHKKPITVLPILDGEKVIGLIRMHDIVQSGL